MAGLQGSCLKDHNLQTIWGTTRWSGKSYFGANGANDANLQKLLLCLETEPFGRRF
jgi:hypothetical protein